MASIAVGTDWTTICNNNISSNYTLAYQMKRGTQDVNNNRTYVYRRLLLIVRYAGASGIGWEASGTGVSTSSHPSETASLSVGTHVVLSGEGWVNHSDDGTWSQNVSGTYRYGWTGSSWMYAWGTGTNTATLPSLPRNAVITSFNNFTIEDGVTIAYTNNIAGKTLTFTVKLDELSDTLASTAIGNAQAGSETIKFTFTDANLAKIRTKLGNAKSGTFIITLTTSGISTTSVVKPTGTLKESVNRPSIATPTVTETALSGKGVGALEFVRYISTKNVSVVVTPGTGTTIKSVVLSNGTNRTNCTADGTTWSGSIGNLTENTIVITATDNRGFTNTRTITASTWRTYAKPSVTEVKFDRNNATTEAGYIQPKGTFWNGTAGNTTNSVSVKFKLNSLSEASFSASQISKSGTNWSGDYSISASSTYKLEREKTYTLRVTVTDSFGQSAYKDASLGTAVLTMWLGKVTAIAPYLLAEHDVGIGKGGAVTVKLSEVASDVTTLKGKVVKTKEVYNATKALSTSNGNAITFSKPSDFTQSLGVRIRRAWPQSSWADGAVVAISADDTFTGTMSVTLTTTHAQSYALILEMTYI